MKKILQGNYEIDNAQDLSGAIKDLLKIYLRYPTTNDEY